MVTSDELTKLVILSVKSEIKKRGLDMPKLAELFKAHGYIDTTEASLRRKIDRGGFSFVFFIQLMKILGVDTLNVIVDDKLSNCDLRLSESSL
jgi:hypothetical protein